MNPRILVVEDKQDNPRILHDPPASVDGREPVTMPGGEWLAAVSERRRREV